MNDLPNMEDLNRALSNLAIVAQKATISVEEFVNGYLKSITKLRIVSYCSDISNNYRKTHGLPMRRRIHKNVRNSKRR